MLLRQWAARRRNILTVTICAAVIAMMLALTYAAVPLYRWFCQVTGFGGTTQVASVAPGAAAARPVTVRFDANTAPNLPWRFTAPESVEVKLGEERHVVYKAVNLGSEPVLGTAIFNVTPLNVGKYFFKIECFCFTEQLLMPGERKEFAVSFFVDPAIAEDTDGHDVSAITLSYTVYNKGGAAREDYMRRHQLVTGAGEGTRR
jgi:cytochrome c oxidase assembly protein subunit 11